MKIEIKKSKKFMTAALSSVLATALIFSGIAIAEDDDSDSDSSSNNSSLDNSYDSNSDSENSVDENNNEWESLNGVAIDREYFKKIAKEALKSIPNAGGAKDNMSQEEKEGRVALNLAYLKMQMKNLNPKLKDSEIENIIKKSVMKVAKEPPKTKLQEVKDAVSKQWSTTIIKRFVSTLVMKYVKGAVVQAVKDVIGVNIVGKTYSNAELARLVNSIDSSVDTISENLKIAKNEFSSMMGETAYRDFMECVTRIKVSHALINDKHEAAVLWAKFKAGEDASKETIDKYAHQAFEEFLDGRYNYIDDLIADYTEFCSRVTTSFTNNGKGIIDVVDEALDKQNDVFSQTYQKKLQFRESVANVAVDVAALLDSVVQSSDDLKEKYEGPSRIIGLSFTNLNKMFENSSLDKKYNLSVIPQAQESKDAQKDKPKDGKSTKPAVNKPVKSKVEQIEKPYLVSKKAYVKSADYISRKPVEWTQFSIRPEWELPYVQSGESYTYFLGLIAPFAKMTDRLQNPDEVIMNTSKSYVKFNFEDFKKSELPGVYKKWNDAYLGKDDVAKLLSNRSANVSFKDYLTNNLKFDLGKDVSTARYLVTDCSMDFTYHWYCRSDFEMRLSYFDVETGKFYADQVVARGDLAVGLSNSKTANMFGYEAFKTWFTTMGDPTGGEPLTFDRTLLRTEAVWAEKNPLVSSASNIKLSGILSGKDGIFAIPFEK